jgi:hypothetical protein
VHLSEAEMLMLALVLALRLIEFPLGILKNNAF